MSGTITIRPVPDENYEGRQWGYCVLVDDEPLIHATTGGTGPCWNLAMVEHDMGEARELEDWHICELDELIDALVALRDSEANRLHAEHWA